MATQAHCAYCFESLVASFEHRKPLGFAQITELWEQHHHPREEVTAGVEGQIGEEDGEDEHEHEHDADMTDLDTDEPTQPKPAAISRLLNSRSASSSSSSLPSTRSSASSEKKAADGSGSTTPASSKTSLSSRSSFSPLARTREQTERHPLFITWSTTSRSGNKSLRGCIGTFDAQELEQGLRSYALASAFEDVRFQPIPASQLPSLSCDVTLLTDFSPPTKDPLDWTMGQHGIRIAFTHHGRRHGATYLPSVAPEQGWTKEETLVSLMRKAGWNGSSAGWLRTWRDGKGELVRYEGKKVELGYAAWREWRDRVSQADADAKDGRR